MTFIAWAAWHDCAPPERPTFTGQAYVGNHGTQRAEFYAAIHGLSGALPYIWTLGSRARPSRIVLHLDNEPVFKLMVGEHQPSDLGMHYSLASDLCAQLTAAGVAVDWRLASEDGPA